MCETDWVFDDPLVADDEELLRRIPRKPTHVTFDSENSQYVPHIAAFRRSEGGGMSVHLTSLLENQGREPSNAYDPEWYGTVAFLASAPRSVGGGVLAITAPPEQEPDAILAAAHGEVRPPTHAISKPEWSLIRDEIIRATRWVTVLRVPLLG